MKNKIYFLFILILLMGFSGFINAQVLITKSDTISITEGSVMLKLNDYIGDIQWEKSADGINWFEIENENTDSLTVVANESNQFRARVIKNNCDPFYSDTTSLKNGVLTQKKANVFSNEICYIQSDFIEFKDSTFLGFINNDTVNLVLANKGLAFVMPEQNPGNSTLKISINDIEYTLDYSVQQSPSIENPESYVSEIINENQTKTESSQNEIRQLLADMSDLFDPTDFNGFFNYTDSLLTEIETLTDNFSSEEFELLSSLLAANSSVLTLEENVNKNALFDFAEEETPEKRLEKLPSIILTNSNHLSLINDNLSTNTGYGDQENDIYDELQEAFHKEYNKSAGNVFAVFKFMANAYGNSMAVLRISQTVNLIRNKFYLLDGDLIPNKPLPLLYNNKKNNQISLTGNYRCFILEDYQNDGLAAVEIALNDFNEQYNLALSTFLIALIDKVGDWTGITKISDQFPLMYRTNASISQDLPIPIEYISSTTESISGSISNQNVSLNSFEKKESGVELSFFTSEITEQDLSWNIDYKHGNYNSKTTTLSAKANPFVPATLTIVYVDFARIGKPSEPLPDKIQVIIEDAEGNPVPGVPIHFYTECEDCGWVFHPFVTTNENGIAETEWALGNEQGFDYVKAKIVDNEVIPPVEFTATAKLYEPKSLEVVASTNNQTGKKEEALPKAIQMLVKDQNGDPLEGIEIEFYFEEDGFGSFNPWIATTDENGIAESVWTLGDFGTQQRAKAKIVGNDEISSVQLFANIEGVKPEPASLEAVASTQVQAGKFSQTLPKPVQALVKDKYDNPIEGIPIYFYPKLSYFGSFEPSIAYSNSLGIAESVWTLGKDTLANTLQWGKAIVLGNDSILPVNFYAEIEVERVPTSIQITSWSYKEVPVSDVDYLSSIEVIVRDQYGVSFSNKIVEFETQCSGCGGSVSSKTGNFSENRIWTIWTPPAIPGTYKCEASVKNYPNVPPAVFTVKVY